MDFRMPTGYRKATFRHLYGETELYRALLQTYTKPLFSWRKALSASHDNRTLYDFARRTPQNAERLHRELSAGHFRFREGIGLEYNFNGKRRTIYIFPWEERIVDLLLYRMLNRYFHGALSPASYAYRFRGFGVDGCQRRLRRVLGRMDGPVYGLRRDVADYFPSVDHRVLLSALREWVEPDDYLFRLLEQRVRFRFRAGDGVSAAERGIPFGTAIACFFANLYLTPLDRAMAGVRGLAYLRYADDILALSESRGAVVQAAGRLDEVLRELRLAEKSAHHLDFRFAARPEPDPEFEPTAKLRYLGLEYDTDGKVRLPRHKFRKLRNLFRFAFRRARRKFRGVQDPDRRAAVAIAVARDVVERAFRSVALIDYYLKHVTDEEQLRLLDRWLAEEVLAISFQNGHRKGNFRRLPYCRLRQMGLPSLRHRRRLILHGHLESSFFVMRTDRLIEKERRRRLPGLRAFSPRLEAAARGTS